MTPTPAAGAYEKTPPLPLPRTVLGTMTFADTADEDTSRELLHLALDSGMRWLDTANNYAGGKGEELLGRLLRELPPGPRAELVVATKVGQPDPEWGDQALLAPDLVRRSVERSLERLGTDRIDLLYLHQPDRSTPLADTLSAVAELADEGLVSQLGLSNYSAWQSADALWIAAETGAPAPRIAQHLYNALARRLDDEYAEFAAVHEVQTVVYNPLAGGLLTGRYRFGEEAASGRFATARNAAQYRDRYWHPGLFAAVDALGRIAEDAGIALPELALRWVLSRPVVGGVLLGGSKPEQLRQNIAAASRGALPDDILGAIEAAAEDLRGPMPAYNR